MGGDGENLMSATPQVRPGRGAQRRGAATAAVALAAVFGAAQAQPTLGDVKHLTVDDLKRGYLACHEASTRRVLAMGEVMHCSVVYEALKQRAFGGDFERLLAWARTQPPRTAAARAGPAAATSCPEDL